MENENIKTAFKFLNIRIYFKIEHGNYSHVHNQQNVEFHELPNRTCALKIKMKLFNIIKKLN